MSQIVLHGLDAAVERAGALAREGRRVLGIAGAPGAGKTTLVEALLAGLTDSGVPGVAHLPMDGFHLADVQLERLGLRGRKGAPETFDVDGYAATLSRVRAPASRTVYAPGFERGLEQPIAAAVAVDRDATLVVTEGNYLLLDGGGWERVRPLLDEAWFVDSPPDRRARLIARHEAFGKSSAAARAWVDAVDEPNAHLVEATRGHAEVLVVL